MENKLEVSFNSPQCGWMSIGFTDAENEFHTTTAHAPHAQALSELLRILTDLLDENLTENLTRNEYILHWNRSPEEFDFRFVKNGSDVLLEIYQYPTEERAAETRELCFSHTGNLNNLCKTFAETFNQLYADRNTDEFEFNWRQPFPFTEYEEFKLKILTDKRELDD